MRYPTRESKRRLPRPAVFVGAVALGLSAGARADVVTNWYFHDDAFIYRLSHMPDFDQRRATSVMVPGLPNDGSMYCAPTASTNQLAYVANHGFSWIQPGAAFYGPGNPLQYDQITSFLHNSIGAAMGTHPSDGTNGNGWYDGTRAHLPESIFTVTMYYPKYNFTPTFADCAKVAIDGAIVSPAYGWYSFIGFNQFGMPRYDRVGGHVVTLVHALGDPVDPEFSIRDPADDSFNKYTQSGFMTRKFGINTVEGEFEGEARFLDNLLDANGDPTSAFIDSYLAVAPKAGYSFQPGAQLLAVLLRPFQLLGTLTPQRAEFSPPAVAAASDMVVCPDLHSWIMITPDDAGGTPKLQLFDRLANQLTCLTEVDNATRACFGRDRELYVLADWELHCFDMTDPLSPQLTASEFMPGPGDAICYDDATDEVVVLSNTEHVIMRYPKQLPGVPADLTFLPGSVPLGGNASIVAYPTIPNLPAADVMLLTDASDSIYAVSSPPGVPMQVNPIGHPSIVDPTSVDVDDAGHLFVATNGEVAELMFDVGTSEWQRVPDEEAPFFGQAVGPMFRVTRSRTNFDAALHSGPKYRNLTESQLVEGEPLLDCDADFNFDRAVDISDLLDMLAEWGPCSVCVADVNADRVTDVTELLRVLADWGPCE